MCFSRIINRVQRTYKNYVASASTITETASRTLNKDSYGPKKGRIASEIRKGILPSGTFITLYSRPNYDARGWAILRETFCVCCSKDLFGKVAGSPLLLVPRKHPISTVNVNSERICRWYAERMNLSVGPFEFG